MNLAPRQIERFLAALTALTRQHGIVMSGPQMELYALTDGQREEFHLRAAYDDAMLACDTKYGCILTA